MHTDRTDLLKSGAQPLVTPDVLVDVLSAASDIAIMLSPEGVIQSIRVNPHHAGFGDLRHWEGRTINSVLTPESIPKVTARLAQLAQAEIGKSLIVEINHSDGADWEFPVRYSLCRLQTGSSILMLGRDLRQIAEMQQKLVAAQMSLERDHESQREMDTRYRVLMEMTRDAVVLVSMSTGRITDLNSSAAVVLGGSRAEIMGSPIAQEFEGRRRGEFLEAMNTLAVSDTAAPIELQARRSQRRVMVVPMVFRAAGERLLLCRLESPKSVATHQDELTENLNRLFNDGVDAVVFTDRDGLVRAVNEPFLNLTDQSNLAAVRGRSLADFLVRGAVDLKILLDNARRAGHMRMYSTKLNTAFDGQIAVEISAAWLNDRPNPILGLIMRDASRVESPRRPGFGPEDGGASVVELVGSSTLKDIVAETTDVIEKLCIETAVELTRNNRVAAAEMLGLSRQSLYVKLRKYGLVNKDSDDHGA